MRPKTLDDLDMKDQIQVDILRNEHDRPVARDDAANVEPLAMPRTQRKSCGGESVDMRERQRENNAMQTGRSAEQR